MRVLLLGNVNMAPLVDALSELDAELGGFDDALLQLLDPASRAHAADVNAVVVHLDGDEFLGRGHAASELVKAVESFVERNPGKLVVLNTFSVSPEEPSSYAVALAEKSSRLAQAREANARLRELARRRPAALLLDLELLYWRFGADSLVSDTFFYLGRIRYTNRMFRELARHIEQLLRGALDRGRKVLALDADGILWRGVIGEDGVGGIGLSEEGAGKAHRDFQALVRDLGNTGVLLVLLSKNEASDVESAFLEHPMMVLSLDDFAASRIDWEPKEANLRAVAGQLGLGLDSFVFLDDSPVEREWMRRALPEVAVPEVPARIEELPRWFLREVVYPFFPRTRLTAEDRERKSRYRARGQREQTRRTLSPDSFLASLDIRLDLELDPRRHLTRASQLSQRTNQFNLTGRRWNVAEMQALLDGPDHEVFLLDYSDRFGREGIVGLLVVDLAAGEIENLLLSCRVIGRGVERTLVECAEAAVRRRGGREVHGCFVPSGRNAPAADLFERCGFVAVGTDPDGTRRWRKELS